MAHLILAVFITDAEAEKSVIYGRMPVPSRATISPSKTAGLTLILLPSSSTLTYDLNLEFTNNHTQKHYTVKAKNAVTNA